MTASLAADAAALPDDDPYRAPESYMGQRFMAPAADVYSLCAVIYRALTRKTPLSLYDVMYKPAAQSPDKVLEAYELPQSGAPFSEDFKAVLEKGLSPLPKDRYADAAALERALAAPPKIVRPNSVKTAQPERPKINHIPAMPKPVKNASQAAVNHARTLARPASAPCLAPDFLSLLMPQLKLTHLKSQYTSYIGREAISSVTFFNTLIQHAPSKVFDVSADKSGRVIAWASGTSYNLKIFVAADGGVTAGRDCRNMFRECLSLQNIYFNHSFDTSAVTDMSGMFENTPMLTSLDFNDFKTDRVTDMKNMFHMCGIRNLNLNHFNTSNVTNMSGMFDQAAAYNIDISSFDTSKVTDMSRMFTHCFNIKSLDLSHFDTSSVTTMAYMFRNCQNLTSLDVSRFNTAKVRDMSFMFSGCKNLPKDVESTARRFNMASMVKKEFMFENAFKVPASSASTASHGTFGLFSQPSSASFNRPDDRPLSASALTRIQRICQDFAQKYSGHFKTGVSAKFRKNFGLSERTPVYLSHDLSLMQTGKTGFAITDRGFYCKDFGDSPAVFTSYHELKNFASIRRVGNYIFAGSNHRLVYASVSGREQADLENLIRGIKSIL